MKAERAACRHVSLMKGKKKHTHDALVSFFFIFRAFFFSCPAFEFLRFTPLFLLLPRVFCPPLSFPCIFICFFLFFVVVHSVPFFYYLVAVVVNHIHQTK